MADFGVDLDGETAVGGDVEVGTFGEPLRGSGTIDGNRAVAMGDFHALWGIGAKVVAAREDQSNGFFGSVL